MKVMPKSVNVVRLFLWTKSIAVIVVKKIDWKLFR